MMFDNDQVSSFVHVEVGGKKCDAMMEVRIMVNGLLSNCKKFDVAANVYMECLI